MERAHVTEHLVGVDQKIPPWLIKSMGLGEVELQLDQVLNLDLLS